jgi:hypothetical protein
MFFCPLVGRVVIRFPDEELELEEDELELDEEELELDEEELELEELELDVLELLDEELELEELLELVVPPQPEMIDASNRAAEPRATRLGKIDFGKAPIFMYLIIELL